MNSRLFFVFFPAAAAMFAGFSCKLTRCQSYTCADCDVIYETSEEFDYVPITVMPCETLVEHSADDSNSEMPPAVEGPGPEIHDPPTVNATPSTTTNITVGDITLNIATATIDATRRSFAATVSAELLQNISTEISHLLNDFLNARLMPSLVNLFDGLKNSANTSFDIHDNFVLKFPSASPLNDGPEERSGFSLFSGNSVKNNVTLPIGNTPPESKTSNHVNTQEGKTWEKSIAIGTWALVGATLVLAGVAWFTIQEAGRTANRQHRHEIALDSLELLDKDSRRLLRDEASLRKAAKQLSTAATAQNQVTLKKKLKTYFANFETFALHVNSSALDIGYANALFGTRLERIYRDFGWFVRQMRRRHRRDFVIKYREIEMMMDDLLLFRRGLYCVDRKVISRLKHEAADPHALDSLRGLDDWKESWPRWLWNRKRYIRHEYNLPLDKLMPRRDLIRELHRRKIWEEKFLICKYAFLESFKIEEDPAPKSSPEFARFLTIIHNSTNHSYPPIHYQRRPHTPESIESQQEGIGHFVQSQEPFVTRFLARKTYDSTRSGAKSAATCVGHISIIDLEKATATGTPYADVWTEIVGRFQLGQPNDFYVIQELCVDRDCLVNNPPPGVADEAMAGLSRSLIRHAIRWIEEVQRPKDWDERRANKQIALAIVRHHNFNRCKDVYQGDGVIKIPNFQTIQTDSGPIDVVMLKFGRNEFNLLV